MSRYVDIEGDWVDKAVKTYSLGYYDDDEYAIPFEALGSAPSIDIVTCYMCKYSHMTYDGQCKYCDNITDDDGNVIEVYFDADHYCSDGEREVE